VAAELGYDWRMRGRHPFQWFLASLVVVALLLPVLFVWWEVRRHQTDRILEEAIGANPRVQAVGVDGFWRGRGECRPLGEYHAMTASVQIKGRPYASITFDHPRSELLSGSDSVWLCQVGGLMMQEDRSAGESSWYMRAVDVGPAGDLGARLPFKVRSLDDAIDHYDELVAFFARQPADEDYRSKTDGCIWHRNIQGAVGAVGAVGGRLHVDLKPQPRSGN